MQAPSTARSASITRGVSGSDIRTPGLLAEHLHRANLWAQERGVCRHRPEYWVPLGRLAHPVAPGGVPVQLDAAGTGLGDPVVTELRQLEPSAPDVQALFERPLRKCFARIPVFG